MRLVAYGHVTGGGAQAPKLREKPSQVGGPGGGDNGECAVALRGRLPRGPRGARRDSQRRARRHRACREGARSGEA